MAIPSFVDRVTLHVYGGDGGHGCASVHREKFKPLGGPDGGNGGDGGSVILRADPGVTTLVDYHRQSHRRATSGQPGRGDHQNGARGEDVVLLVPEGTVVTDELTGEQLADLTGADPEVVVALGGRGGLATQRWPRAPGKRPDSRCWAPTVRRGPSPSSSRSLQTSVWSGFRAPASPLWSRPSREPGPRSPTTRSPRWCPTWAWSWPATSRSPWPTCRA